MVVVDVLARAIDSLDRAAIEATPEGTAYLVPMTPAAVLRLMERAALATIDVIVVDVIEDGKTIVIRETARQM